VREKRCDARGLVYSVAETVFRRKRESSRARLKGEVREGEEQEFRLSYILSPRA
jgi:hypothetical protein